MFKNRVELTGHLYSDPYVFATTEGKMVAYLKLKLMDSWKDKQTGEVSERQHIYSVVVFDHLAEMAKHQLKKDDHLEINGRLKTRVKQNELNEKTYITEVIGQVINVLDTANEGNAF